jgi:hypothetical protein
MSLFFYGVFILGVVLYGLVLLVLYSLLAMARKGDESLDHLELEILQTQEYTSPLMKRGKSANLHAPVTSDLFHGGPT